MKRLIPNVLLITATFLGATPTFAAVSPHETVSATIDGDKVSITYGRPYTKSPRSGEVRKIWGGLVPYDKVWRTGANAVTKITFGGDVSIEGQKLAAGSYGWRQCGQLRRTSRSPITARTLEASMKGSISILMSRVNAPADTPE